LTPIGLLAAERGKSVGFVTTTRVTHATPAGVYARTPERDWESDRYLPPGDQEHGCRDIAYQLLHAAGGGLDVAMGGGREDFYGAEGGGERRDPKADLVHDWLQGGDRRRYVTATAQLDALKPSDQVLGLFANSHMTYSAEKTSASTEPTLAEMATTAIRLLDDDPDGYFLLVEGGRIDHGHHDGKPGYALLETQEFAKAIQAVLDRVDLDETLILVTADHSHTFTFGGYATRGNPILGLVVHNDKRGEPKSAPDIAADGQSYTAAAYANGPGAVRKLPRPAPATGIDALAQSLVPMRSKGADGVVDNSETHGGEDVPLYATGAGARAVHGVIEQNRIFDIMMQAYGWREATTGTP
jgi:alkaline phosphatase